MTRRTMWQILALILFVLFLNRAYAGTSIVGKVLGDNEAKVTEVREKIETDDDGESEVVRTSRTVSLQPTQNAPGLKTDSPSENDLEKRIAALEQELRALKTQKAYEIVPPEQREAIAARLAVVGEILRRTGKAYDYRSHTLAQLREILRAAQ